MIGAAFGAVAAGARAGEPPPLLTLRSFRARFRRRLCSGPLQADCSGATSACPGRAGAGDA
eukprot:5916044-Lingulodinium_polyedra.AAC.1